jgi:hypothetical protein
VRRVPNAAADAAAEYRRLAVAWNEARDTPDEANRLFDQLHAFYKRIRDTDAGRLAILGLLDDPITAVRLTAASHALPFATERATETLEALAQEDNLHAVTAKWTLRSFRQGKLNFDW